MASRSAEESPYAWKSHSILIPNATIYLKQIKSPGKLEKAQKPTDINIISGLVRPFCALRRNLSTGAKRRSKRARSIPQHSLHPRPRGVTWHALGPLPLLLLSSDMPLLSPSSAPSRGGRAYVCLSVGRCWTPILLGWCAGDSGSRPGVKSMARRGGSQLAKTTRPVWSASTFWTRALRTVNKRVVAS